MARFSKPVLALSPVHDSPYLPLNDDDQRRRRDDYGFNGMLNNLPPRLRSVAILLTGLGLPTVLCGWLLYQQDQREKYTREREQESHRLITSTIQSIAIAAAGADRHYRISEQSLRDIRFYMEQLCRRASRTTAERDGCRPPPPVEP